MLGEDGRGLEDVVLKELDDNIGIVLRKLDELRAADDTIVLFISDSGPETSTWPDGGTTPFHGEKSTTWEGGFRVPAIIRWPGKVQPNTLVNEIFDAMDWMPTLIAAASGPEDLATKLRDGYLGYKVHLDGDNQLGLLLGKGPSERKEIVEGEGRLDNVMDEIAAFTAPSEPGLTRLRVSVTQGPVTCEAEALITVTDSLLPESKETSNHRQGLPGYTFKRAPGELWRSRYDTEQNVIVINNGHRDFVFASSTRTLKLRYIARLFAKELVCRNFPGYSPGELLERLIELLLYTEENLK